MKKTYHICLSGGDEVMFRDEEDFTRGINCMCIEKRLYKLENDKILYLEQTSEEKYILLTITFWFLLSTIGIGFLWGLFVILKALIRL
jgi:hypothetical protein